MLKSLVIATTLALAPYAAVAQAPELVPASALPAGKYTLDPTHASLTWKVNHMGLSHYTARFTKMDATVVLDPKDITKTTLVASVDPSSVKTDYPKPEEKDFDAKLAGPEWLNAAKFPQITFTSTSITKTSETTGKIAGDLTFLGVTKPIVLDATFNGGMTSHPFTKGAAMGISATTTLKRSDWGFSTYVPMIGDEVQLLIETEFFHQPK